MPVKVKGESEYKLLYSMGDLPGVQQTTAGRRIKEIQAGFSGDIGIAFPF